MSALPQKSDITDFMSTQSMGPALRRQYLYLGLPKLHQLSGILRSRRALPRHQRARKTPRAARTTRSPGTPRSPCPVSVGRSIAATYRAPAAQGTTRCDPLPKPGLPRHGPPPVQWESITGAVSLSSKLRVTGSSVGAILRRVPRRATRPASW
jgi:hypothetical protein